MTPKKKEDKIKQEKRHEKDVLNNLEPKNNSLGSFVLETLLNIVMVLLVVGVVRWFVVTPFVVEGESMETAFSNGEYILVDKLSYQFNEPERGDVVIFTPPTGSADYYIKRIIGLPGETVKLKDGYVYVCNEEYPDCFELDETNYLSDGSMGKACVNQQSCPDVSYQIPDFAYFVLGDNRTQSHDSRSFEGAGGTFYVPKGNIAGKSWFGAWPTDEFGFTPRVEYNYPEPAIQPEVTTEGVEVENLEVEATEGENSDEEVGKEELTEKGGVSVE